MPIGLDREDELQLLLPRGQGTFSWSPMARWMGKIGSELTSLPDWQNVCDTAPTEMNALFAGFGGDAQRLGRHRQAR